MTELGGWWIVEEEMKSNYEEFTHFVGQAMAAKYFTKTVK